MGSKKILILSLGTGSYSLRDNESDFKYNDEYVFENKLSVYRKANYEINGERYIEKPYVAEPLIMETQPDEIIILGSVKSTWSGLFLAFAEETSHMREDFIRLREFDTGKTIEKDGKLKKVALFGLSTPGEELDRIEKEINGIFAGSNLFQNLCKEVKTWVFLLRYGIDQEELEENYRRLGRIKELFMEKDTTYEVSFDITHAFRSMSIYNLIILNYLKNITGAHIHIRNVFYGNLDVSRENYDIATIVDLEDIVDVLDLTNGVSEFRNTGNAKTLLENLPTEEKDGYVDGLRMFDHATQINDFNMIQKALRKLDKEYYEKTCGKRTDSKEHNNDAAKQGVFQDRIIPKTDAESRTSVQRTRYEDYREMVQHVIATELYGDETWKYDDFSSLSMGEQRLRLGKWYMRQNRYGVAIATGLEALRSFLVHPYLDGLNNTPVTQPGRSPEEDENNRRNAEDALGRAVQAIEEEEQKTDLSKTAQIPLELLDLAVKMRDAAQETKPIRNAFAHNLKEDSRTAAITLKEKEKEPDLNDVQQIENTKEIEEAFRKCKVFFEVLETFSKALLDNPEAAVKLLQMKPKKKISGKDSAAKNKKVRQAYIIWHNYNTKNEGKYNQIRNAILDELHISDKEKRKAFPIMQYPAEHAVKCKKGIDEQLQYAYEVFSSGKVDSETAIIYCDDSSINSFGDFASLMNLIPKLMACGFLDIYYLNIYRKPSEENKIHKTESSEKAEFPKTEKINLKLFSELKEDNYKEKLLGKFKKKYQTNPAWQQMIQDSSRSLI